MGFVPNDHETLFKLIPVGVNYQCELCNRGNMIADKNEPVMIELTNPPTMGLRTHICDKCGGVMKLPKTYPYVEWVSVDEYANLVDLGVLKHDSHEYC